MPAEVQTDMYIVLKLNANINLQPAQQKSAIACSGEDFGGPIGAVAGKGHGKAQAPRGLPNQTGGIWSHRRWPSGAGGADVSEGGWGTAEEGLAGGAGGEVRGFEL